LSRHRAEEVPLVEEMELVRGYLAIEQARFSDRLRIHLDVPSSLHSAAVPSFALQHLVENAIRHGIARHPDAGRVSVTARRDGDRVLMTVTDDGAGIDAAAAGLPGHGLATTRERLHALYGNRASLTIGRSEQGGTSAVLEVPYRSLTVEAGHDED
jgi:two-component system LytT family sensor kinase